MSEEERVTVIDVLVSFERSRAAAWARSRQSPADLATEDFTVQVDGSDQAVVSVEALEDSDAAGWTQMVYVDCRMVSQPQLQWALSALAARVDELVSRGPVEVVVADPAPQTLLSASRDAAVVAPVLAQLAQRETCRDFVSALRDEALETEADLAEAHSAEQNLTLSSRLALVTRLTDGLRREGGAQKALYLVHAGFDTDPRDFYPEAHPENAGAETESADDFGRLVASYGWSVVALGPADATARDVGVYIGSWYFTGATGGDNPEKTEMDVHMDLPTDGGQPVDDGDPWQSFLGGIRGKLKENKDAGKAESYLELGQALFGQGKYERAVESYEKALYHFADAPATRDQQTLALVQLGNALAAAGDRDRARRAVDAALDRRPELARRAGAVPIGLDDRGHDALVAATDGLTAASPDELDTALSRLYGKVRVTYQMAGDPRGRLLPLEVAYDGAETIHHARWTRSSTPEALARYRALRLADPELRGETVDDGGLDLAAARTESGTVDLGQAMTAAGLNGAEPRAFVVAGSAADGLGQDLRRLTLDESAVVSIEVPEGFDYVVLVVDDLESGAWGAAVFGQ